MLTECSNHMVKVGKRCTPLTDNGTYEKSFVWLVNKDNLRSFDEKINKMNCEMNEEKNLKSLFIFFLIFYWSVLILAPVLTN